MRIVLDSNVLLIAIGRKSRFRPIWTAFINQQYKLIVSDEIIYEYEEILQQRSAADAAILVMEILSESPGVVYQQIYYSWNMIKKDPDDNKFFDIAVAGNADYLVTNDAHFNIIKQSAFPAVKLITADGFLDILKNL